MNGVQMIARLSSLIVAALKAPMPDAAQMSIFAAVLEDAQRGSPLVAGGGELQAGPFSASTSTRLHARHAS